MCSDDLNPQQLAAMAEVLGRHARYLSRLVERMNKLGWPKDDLLYARTMYARDGAISLLGTVHDVKAKRLAGNPCTSRPRAGTFRRRS